MANSLYITTSEAASGKSLVSLGIMEMLHRKIKKVGFFRPIISRNYKDGRDKHIELMINYFNLDQAYEESFAFHSDQIDEMISRGEFNSILDRVFERFKALEKKCDFVLCEGSNFDRSTSHMEFDINVDFARSLGCPVLMVGSAGDAHSVKDAITPLKIAVDAYLQKDCTVVGSILNRVHPDMVENLKKELSKKFYGLTENFAVIPEADVLVGATMKEIADHLGAEVLYGADKLFLQGNKFVVAAMHLPHFLEYIEDNSVIITPGDRGDILLGSLMANDSKNYPFVSGVVLSAGKKLSSSIEKLLDGLPNIVPVLAVKENTFETAIKLNSLHTHITYDNDKKITHAIKHFEEHIDTEKLENSIITTCSMGMSPKMFEYNLIQKAKSNKMHIVLPEGNDERILRAGDILAMRKIVNVTVLSDNVEETENFIGKLGLNRENFSIVQPSLSPNFDDYVDTLYEIRKEKGLTREHAADLMNDVSYFGTMMVHKGDADGMVSGAAHTTQHTILPALQFVKTKKGCSIVSSVFFMCLDDRVLVYGDCAVNPNPTAEQLAEIAIASADTAKAFGIEPKVAMLSYSSGSSGKGEEVEKVRTATNIVKDIRPDILVEGPIQYDAAVDKKTGEKKIPGSKVAGQATVLIFPDLNTGNNTYKAVQRETKAIAIGPILQGLNKPVNDLSRGCLIEDVVNTVIMTAIQAQNAK